LREIFQEQGLGMAAERRFFLGITGLHVFVRKGTPSSPAPP
jgi:hypothetical protein